ncbi:MAG: L-asparaginase [uncultured Pyrinomonadaceae bacterium]|uniref:L-asparaginase n=1 Tax=uncultured Pyrinomonadaceae bacterium TaxID=2283094 RepID=A0A6J4PJR3_9BACT|nr:MAG: L-asparaginase [uncultured Pyrinomonadaceae bacterium]
MKNLLLLFSFLLLLAASVSAQSKDGRIAAEIRRVMDAQVAAWNAGDIDAFMRGYWNSPELVFVSGDTVTKGWQPTIERYKKRYDSRAKMGTLTFSDLEIEVLSKDAAKVLGSWSLAREADNPKGKFTLIFRRFKDGWKIVHDHTS